MIRSASLVCAGPAYAQQDLTWDASGATAGGGGTGTWDTTSPTWFNGATYQAWSNATPDSAVCGTPEDCAEQLAAHLDAGVQEICLVPHAYDPEQMERFAAEVRPLLGSLVGAA